MVVTRDGSHVLISLKDQKRLMLLSQHYPTFLGEGKFSRKTRQPSKKQRVQSDSGVSSGSESSDSEDDCSPAHNHSNSTDDLSMFAGEIPEDSIQVVDACNVDNECMVEVQFPEGNLSSVEVEEINAVAIMNCLGCHAA